MAGIAVFAVICCALPILAATVGFGVLLPGFTSPWVLIPTALAMVEIVAWYLRR